MPRLTSGRIAVLRAARDGTTAYVMLRQGYKRQLEWATNGGFIEARRGQLKLTALGLAKLLVEIRHEPRQRVI